MAKSISFENGWGINCKKKLYTRSVVESVKKRLHETPNETPGMFSGKGYGYIRIPICGEYGLKLVSSITDMCKKKGKQVNAKTMAESIIRCVMDEDAEFAAFGGNR